MGDKRVRFRSRERASAARAAELLRELADKLQQEQVTFHREGESVSIRIPGEFSLEIEVAEKHKKYGRKVGIEIELEWIEGADGAEGAGGVSLE